VSAFGWGIVYLLGVYRFLMGRRPPSHEPSQRAAHAFSVLLLMIAGYSVVYLVTPQNLAFHLDTSLERLLMQLWPTALLAYFLWVATPEEALHPKTSRAGL